MHEPTVEAERRRVAQADQRIAAARARVERMGSTLHIGGATGGPPSFIVAQSCCSQRSTASMSGRSRLQQIEPRSGA